MASALTASKAMPPDVVVTRAIRVHDYQATMSRDQSQLLLFITVPDGKTVKDWVYLDLRPAGRPREQETERILALGASPTQAAP